MLIKIDIFQFFQLIAFFLVGIVDYTDVNGGQNLYQPIPLVTRIQTIEVLRYAVGIGGGFPTTG